MKNLHSSVFKPLEGGWMSFGVIPSRFRAYSNVSDVWERQQFCIILMLTAIARRVYEECVWRMFSLPFTYKKYFILRFWCYFICCFVTWNKSGKRECVLYGAYFVKLLCRMTVLSWSVPKWNFIISQQKKKILDVARYISNTGRK